MIASSSESEWQMIWKDKIRSKEKRFHKMMLLTWQYLILGKTWRCLDPKTAKEVLELEQQYCHLWLQSYCCPEKMIIVRKRVVGGEVDEDQKSFMTSHEWIQSWEMRNHQDRECFMMIGNDDDGDSEAIYTQEEALNGYHRRNNNHHPSSTSITIKQNNRHDIVRCQEDKNRKGNKRQ